MNIKVDISRAGVSRKAIESCRDAQEAAQERLWSGKEEYTGWVKLPLNFDADLLDRILYAADRIAEQCDRLIVIGIGGSYLGAKAVIEALSHTIMGGDQSFYDAACGNGADRSFSEAFLLPPRVLFAGWNLSAAYHAKLLSEIREHETCLCVISKSGTTTETAAVYALLKEALIKKYGKEKAAEHIYVITDAKKGALREEAEREGYVSFDVPDDVGGRYSVLTAVGLLPIAVAGVDIRELILGAETMASSTAWDFSAPDYACVRYLLSRGRDYNGNPLESDSDSKISPKVSIESHRSQCLEDGRSDAKAGQTLENCQDNVKECQALEGCQGDDKSDKPCGKKSIEVFEYYEPQLAAFAEWLKQLFGESEGKDGKGLFPVSLSMCADLHSMGQLLQDGNKIFFETVLNVEKPPIDLKIPDGAGELLSGRSLHELNQVAMEGTLAAHAADGVSAIKIDIPELTPFYIGQLIYFFEASCGISAYMLGVNPFDQPGVEKYKAEMKKLLQR